MLSRVLQAHTRRSRASYLVDSAMSILIREACALHICRQQTSAPIQACWEPSCHQAPWQSTFMKHDTFEVDLKGRHNLHREQPQHTQAHYATCSPFGGASLAAWQAAGATGTPLTHGACMFQHFSIAHILAHHLSNLNNVSVPSCSQTNPNSTHCLRLTTPQAKSTKVWRTNN